MYKNFIFDVYGTLVDIRTNEYENSAWSKLSETLSFYGVDYTPQELSETYFSSCEWQMRTGAKNFKHPEVDVVEVFRHLFENKGKKAGKSLATHLAQEFRSFTTQYIRVYDGVLETLTKLKKAGKKLYIVSNAQSCYTKQELAKLGLRKYFSGIIYSSDQKCAKPDATLFNALINKHKLERKQCVYIGNDPVTDVDGARNAKIDCLWIKTNLTPCDVSPKLAPKYTVSSGDFTEITKILLKK
ncbi:MAG: HAD family hydrolase [Clostridiales bacterium]|nr:HAD family hydrolase [Clostridiales bacterium]